MIDKEFFKKKDHSLVWIIKGMNRIKEKITDDMFPEYLL